MLVNVEIEKKYKVLKNNGQAENLDSLLTNLAYVSSTQVVDHYLDTSDGAYYQEGIFIRVRNNAALEIKFNPEHLATTNEYAKEHTTCHEYNFPLPLQLSSDGLFQRLQSFISIKKPYPYTFENFVKENALKPLVTLDKTRTAYENEALIVAVDILSDFGTFIEFEAKDSSINMDDFLQAVKNLTKGIQLKPINSGYVEIALQQSNDALYRKGKYLIEDGDTLGGRK